MIQCAISIPARASLERHGEIALLEHSAPRCPFVAEVAVFPVQF